MTEASPPKWHLAHTSWFFEVFILEAVSPDYRPFHPKFRYLFNSYYNAVGEQHPRPQRGLITRPTLGEVLQYRAYVDEHMAALLDRGDPMPMPGMLELGINHEQQHQELILMDIKHLFSHNVLYPIYREQPAISASSSDMGWIGYGGGVYEIGHGGEGFAFDNEKPRHRAYVDSFELGSRPVTVGEYLEFMADGGYERPVLWLSDGWDQARAQQWVAPQYWTHHEGRWYVYTLGGLRALDPEEPVCHVSYYEADAYASWAGARLPREGEWEIAAAEQTVSGNFVESGVLHPRAAEGGESEPGALFGDVWEWTQSPYIAYPGYQAPSGAVGEYNGKFMSNQMVLRGGCCVSPRSHLRATYRNFFPPEARWPFCGFRLARDGG